MSKLLPQSELDDLESIELTDHFIENNLDRPFNADYARTTLNETTENFVKAFFVDQGDSVTRLHSSLKECASVLGEMEEVLQQFISQLGCIQQDIGHVREVLAETAIQLANAKAAEKVLWAAVSCLVVPPEVVQVVTQSSDEQLGPQFMLCVRELLKYLNYRKGTWRQNITAAQRERAQRLQDVSVRPGGGYVGRAPPTDAPDDRAEVEALREVRFSLAECRVYYDLMSILDALALYTCIKIKTFLSKKLLILTNKNTNVCIQQDHVLRQYSFYVHFLRSSVPLLRHVYSAPPRGQPPGATSAAPAAGDAHNVGGAPSSNVNTTLIPYRIARALYEEFKREYCVIVSNVYLQKMQDYAFFCNSMEFSTETTATGSVYGAGSSSSGGGSGGGGFWGFGGAAASTPAVPAASLTSSSALGARTAGGGMGGGGVGGGSSDTPNYGYAIPLLTDTSGGGAYVAMRLGERESVLRHVFAPPLIPTMERAARRKHTYEETFRSILSLTCDVVTHEYLFTFDFFSGDMSVYVDVFKPTVQFIVDYLSEIVLVNSSGNTRRMLNERPRTSVNTRAKQDTYGLLILIRLCHEYRSMMKHTRKLTCLDGFFDSLLVLLWPPFNTCYERQLNALMSAKNNNAVYECMTHLKRPEDRLSFVHPLVKAFAEFSCVLMSLSYGAMMSEEARSAASMYDVERRQRLLRRQHRREQQQEGENQRDGAPHSMSGPLQLDSTDSSLSGSSSTRSSASARSYADAETAGGGASGHASGGRQGAHEPATVGSTAWDAALRRQALTKVEQEHESDAADSKSHFLTLMGDVGFMRLELAHLMVQMGEEMATAATNVQQRTLLKPLSKAFALNNLFYLLQVSSQYPIILVRDDAATAASVSGEADPQETVTLDQRDDLNGLKDLYNRFRGEFVENVIRAFLGKYLHVVQNEESCTPNEVLSTADSFVLHWKSTLDLLRQTIRSLIADPANAQDVTAQVCMDLLLYNTRFHAVVAKFLEASTKAPATAEDANPFKGRTLRSLIVTNQLLLQHMRTFSIPLSV